MSRRLEEQVNLWQMILAMTLGVLGMGSGVVVFAFTTFETKETAREREPLIVDPIKKDVAEIKQSVSELDAKLEKRAEQINTKLDHIMSRTRALRF